jgi:uncharacterized protein
VRFWDASAIVPLVVPERRTRSQLERLETDRGIAVWWGTRVECTSALRRRERAGVDIGDGPRLLGELAGAWVELAPSEQIRVTAERLLAVHPLRAADSLQLAAAIAWRRDLTRSAEFVSFDERLRDAASREGFDLVPETLG